MFFFLGFNNECNVFKELNLDMFVKFNLLRMISDKILWFCFLNLFVCLNILIIFFDVDDFDFWNDEKKSFGYFWKNLFLEFFFCMLFLISCIDSDLL